MECCHDPHIRENGQSPLREEIRTRQVSWARRLIQATRSHRAPMASRPPSGRGGMLKVPPHLREERQGRLLGHFACIGQVDNPTNR